MSCFDQPGPSHCGVPQREMQADPLRVDAHNIARELFSQDPRYQDHAMNAIRQEVRALDPFSAERFSRLLNEETRGQSPLREVPEVRRDQYNRTFNTGNDLLVMTDPYGDNEVLKQIRHEQADNYDNGYDRRYAPAPPPVIVERAPGYYNGVQNPVVQGLELGAGMAVGNEIVRDLFHHRR